MGCRRDRLLPPACPMSQRYHTRSPAQKQARREKDRVRAADRIAKGLAPRLRSPCKREPGTAPQGVGRPSAAERRGWYRDSYWYTHRRAAGSALPQWRERMVGTRNAESDGPRYNPTLPALRFLDDDVQ